MIKTLQATGFLYILLAQTHVTMLLCEFKGFCQMKNKFLKLGWSWEPRVFAIQHIISQFIEN